MNSRYRMTQLLALLALSALNLQLSTVLAQGTAFSYQGKLNEGGNPANGIYDLQFGIYDAVTNGNAVSGLLTNAVTPVSNGLFSVTLDFGSSVFTGPGRWLEVDVRTNGGGAFITLAPRQAILPVPYTIMASSASNLLGTLPAAQLSGIVPAAQLPADMVTNGSTGITLAGAFSGNGSLLTNLNGANLAAGSVPLTVLDSSTQTKIASAGTGDTLVNGTNSLSPIYQYTPTANFVIAGATNQYANGVYTLSSSNDMVSMTWSGPNGGTITLFWSDDDWAYENPIMIESNSVSLFNSSALIFSWEEGANGPDPASTQPLYPMSNGQTNATIGWVQSTNTIGFAFAGGLVSGNYIGTFTGTFTGTGSGATLSTPGWMQPSNVSTLSVNHEMRKSAGGVPLMGFTSTELINSPESYAVAFAQWMNTSGAVDAGYNTLMLDASWASWDSSGNVIFNPTRYPSGFSYLQGQLAANRVCLGLYITAQPFEGTPYFGGGAKSAYQYGVQFAAFGVRHVKVDGMGNLPWAESAIRGTLEQISQGLDDGAAQYGLAYPIYLTAVVGANYAWLPSCVNGIYNSQAVARMDSGGFGDGSDANPNDRIAVLNVFLTNCPALVMPGCQFNPEGLGHPWGVYNRGWWNTNYARADMGAFCMGPFPLWIMANDDPGFPTYTNREAIAINQDPLVNPGRYLTSSAGFGTNYGLQHVLYRKLSNGDVALGCWNWDTNNQSQFTVPLAKVPGLATNQATVLDVFGRSSAPVGGSLSALVNPGGFNLYRLSR